MLSYIETGFKKAALEVQEYVLLVAAALRGVVTRPYYRHDIIEQFDLIGIGSMTVVLLTGFFTGAVLALQSGITLDQFGARPFVGRLISASMIKELQAEMKSAAANLDFERAASLRDTLKSLRAQELGLASGASK